MAVAAIPPSFYSPYLDDQLSKLAAKQIPWEVSCARSSTTDNTGVPAREAPVAGGVHSAALS